MVGGWITGDLCLSVTVMSGGLEVKKVRDFNFRGNGRLGIRIPNLDRVRV